MPASHLWWLPQNTEWNEEFRAIGAAPSVEWSALARLANFQMDLLRTERLDALVRRKFSDDAAAPPVDIRLAVLGSCMVSHLVPAIRVAFLRRGIRAQGYTNPFGQYLQDLADPNSALHEFKPNAVLFAFDARHMLGKIAPARDAAANSS